MIDPDELRRAVKNLVPHKNRAQRRAKPRSGAVSTATRNRDAAERAKRRE